MRNGEIIARQVLGFPMFNHYGIVIDANRGIIGDFGSRKKRVIPFHEFMANKKSFELTNSNMVEKSSDEILNQFEKTTPGPFNLYWNNCADFMKNFGRPDLYHAEMKKIAGCAVIILAAIIFVVAKS
tara:strand:- start:4464 stop:4844 length:381 start_codon:yes stop_codon:yes gene_type:complete